MKQLVLFLLIAALGNALYHVSQKTLAPAANPMVLLMAVYAVAFVAAALAAPFFRTSAPIAWTAQVFNWPVLALGVSVLLIEIGFLLAYRSGGSLQWSGVAVNGVSAILLLPVALLVFREAFSPARAMGLLLTLSGLAIMTRN
jgi:drug/metabolite transporter (DMT)-like permease